ncbi:MAG TPA: tRNA uridine-5-carboxymethylaminomethyl(34) synthesis enzyme MnmG [Bacilli bacterium]|nr:tRNA uridine-5-carboxymethylaminomethyl(34) synthesis enzyme MnmG [Bacilli bacterium]
MYEVIIVGGGHAGIEAALACARKGHKTLLVTGNINNIGDTPCNPSIGGPAKGVVVREIDALGGEMGKNTDKSLLQIKMLNTKKGPAVRALRAQIDKKVYPRNMLTTLRNTKNLDIKEAMVENLVVENNNVKGIVLATNEIINSKVVILTTGTYLRAVTLRGTVKKEEGPHGEKRSNELSNNLKKLGYEIQRLKTGTPPRIERSSINFTKTIVQPGDEEYHTFSFDNEIKYDIKLQDDCYLIYTTPTTHEIVNANLTKSSMYGGVVEGIGPRYCPSIEDKIVRFKDKERHQLFLEPESREYDDIYIQGFSTSMPEDIQDLMVHSLPGLEQAQINKYAYAIEYDAINPLQIKQTLETKVIENLYTAGQINGTSGYEEAACQGLMAGINASLKLEGKEPLILRRNEAYIGVLIDDLVTKGTKEPYRLLTSRAEFRLLLRHDNADLRLTEYGKKIGLIDENRYEKFKSKKKDIEYLENKLKETYLTPKDEINKYLESQDINKIVDKISLFDLLKRPDVEFNKITKFLDNKEYQEDVISEVETIIKYEGYIKKAIREKNKMDSYEDIKIPDFINYQNVKNLATEAREKLIKVKPTSLGQAMRISGVNPSDISILMIYLKKGVKNE